MYLTTQKDLLKHCGIRNGGGFTKLRRYCAVMFVCVQTIIKCYYQIKIRKRHLQSQDLVTEKMQLNQKKGSLKMNRQKLTKILFNGF